jgi:hypothetical protein
MATKKIILDFKQQPIVGTSFQYKIYINGVLLNYSNTLTYLDLNYKSGGNNAPFQIGLGATLSDTINNTVSFLTSVYSASSSSGGYLTSVAYARVDDTIEVTITSTAPSDQITFWEMLSDDDYIFLRPDNPCEAIYLSNGTSANAEPIFALASGNYQIKNITLNTTKNVAIPSTFDCLFEKGYSYAVQQGGATLLTFNVTASVTIANLNLVLTNNTLTIDLVASNAILEYSLDGETWQEETIFNDVPAGENILYVRDVYRCVKEFPVTNNGDTNGNVTTPYTYISESNSLRFIKRVVHGNCGNYKNQFNTLSCEETTSIANKYIQLFQSCDTDIKTQIKTSYDGVEVYAKDSDGNFTDLSPTKIVNNIGISDKRDCTYYSYNGNLAVLFTSGNLYDYDTTDVIGTYTLNGALPDYGTIGTWVETAYGTLQIANIRLDDNGQRSLIFNAIVNIVSPISGTIQTIYNRESYDIWEFTTDMSLFTDLSLTIGVRFYSTTSDPNFPDVFWMSEKISVKTRWERSIEIVWSNSKNTDIYFYSGITMKNRLNLCFINTWIGDGDIELQKTDSQVISIDATNYNAVEFEALALTTGMIRKIALALKHDNLIIENVPYKLSENPETERQGESNFYKIKAKLLEAGDVWNQGTANTQTVVSQVPLIGLLGGDLTDEYQRIQ